MSDGRSDLRRVSLLPSTVGAGRAGRSRTSLSRDSRVASSSPSIAQTHSLPDYRESFALGKVGRRRRRRRRRRPNTFFRLQCSARWMWQINFVQFPPPEELSAVIIHSISPSGSECRHVMMMDGPVSGFMHPPQVPTASGFGHNILELAEVLTPLR